jgi:two-component system OmpR family response regulator
LPGIDGLETCRRIRALSVPSPILLLSARGEVEDRVAGLDAGADDYVAKPFFLDEILARLRAFARRPGGCSDGLLRSGSLWFDPATRCAGQGSTEIPLTPRQAAVLEVLMRNARQVLTRSSIADAAWEGTLDLRSNVVDVHVAALRRKLERAGPSTIETVRGLGYRLVAAGP